VVTVPNGAAAELKLSSSHVVAIQSGGGLRQVIDNAVIVPPASSSKHHQARESMCMTHDMTCRSASCVHVCGIYNCSCIIKLLLIRTNSVRWSSVWSRGMIPPLGGGGREFESRNGPTFFVGWWRLQFESATDLTFFVATFAICIDLHVDVYILILSRYSQINQPTGTMESDCCYVQHIAQSTYMPKLLCQHSLGNLKDRRIVKIFCAPMGRRFDTQNSWQCLEGIVVSLLSSQSEQRRSL
jgi:hypothetical protein